MFCDESYDDFDDLSMEEIEFFEKMFGFLTENHFLVLQTNDYLM